MAVNENKQGAAAGSALMPGFMKQQPAVQQMKTLGGMSKQTSPMIRITPSHISPMHTVFIK